MKKLMSSQRVFKEIAEKQTYDRLEEYKSNEVWSALTDADREALALLFVSKGELELKNGNKTVTQTFALASRIAPSSVKVLLRQGLAFAQQQRNIRCLLLACKVLKLATALDASCFEVWFLWAKVLVQIGNFHNEAKYLKEADDKFSKAMDIASKKNSVDGKFFWQWGLCWYYHGKLSGEAMDFKIAVDKYQEASQCGVRDACFWNDYGNALVDLGCLLGRYELIFSASQMYQSAIDADGEYFPARLNLACSYQELYEVSGAEDFFRLADESFRGAVALNTDDVSLWIKWGVLYLNAGKLQRDVRRVESAIERFQKANDCEPRHSLVLERWAEAETLLGLYTDRLDLLRAAEAKILESCTLASDGSHIWYVYGCCLNALGRYFDDMDYYHHALDRFQHGLSLHPKEVKLIHGMALSYFAIGDSCGDVSMLEKSIGCFNDAVALGNINASQFWNDWGVALMKIAQLSDSRPSLEEAVEKFEYAITMQGGDQDTTMLDPELLYNYGCALDFLGDFSDEASYYERSIKVLAQVVVLDPDYVHARYNLAIAWSHLGELTSDVDCFRKALEQFEAVIANDNEDEMAWNDWGLALLNLANLINDPACEQDTKTLYQQVENTLFRAIALGSVQAFYNMACLYSLMGNYAGAIHHLERAMIAGTLPPLDDMMHDEWLEGLRSTESFHSFVNHIASKQQES